VSKTPVKKNLKTLSVRTSLMAVLIETSKAQDLKSISVTLKPETQRSPLPLGPVAFNANPPLQVLRNHKYMKDLEAPSLALNVNILNKIKDNKNKESTPSLLIEDLRGTAAPSINNKDRYCPVPAPGTKRIDMANTIFKSQSCFLNKAFEREAQII